MSTRRKTMKVTPQEQYHEENIPLAQVSPRVISYMEYEVEQFEDQSAAFLASERDKSQFIPFRLGPSVL